MNQIFEGSVNDLVTPSLSSGTSMITLINWNVSKAIEANPNINLKTALKETQDRLLKDARGALMVQSQEEKYLTCALLAWQQLGNTDADSLYSFVEKHRNEWNKEQSTSDKVTNKRPSLSPGSFISYEESKLLSEGVSSSNYDTYSMNGPVVRLPVQSKLVMQLKVSNSVHNVEKTLGRKKKMGPKDELAQKINEVCCEEVSCMEKCMTDLDRSINELRTRAQDLARREAQRIETLERAEAAWKDLELGYERRLTIAEEKEEEMTALIKKLVEERYGYKTACSLVGSILRDRGEVGERESANLTAIEKELCEVACVRLRISEEAARLDAELADHQCKDSLLDRDLQFRELQTRQTLQKIKSEYQSAQSLLYEAGNVLATEFSSLHQKIEEAKEELREEAIKNGQLQEQLDVVLEEKFMTENELEECETHCESQIQGQIDGLKKKKQMLEELKQKVLDCQCKTPVDASVQVKRTPSLAALCQCSPEEKYLNTCSCTSLRSTLMSNLLAELFGGLQSEMEGGASVMPCQLLKCLEDSHSWDKGSVVKTNLRNYFSDLLVGELNIAIATSIEKYHATWVGASCADAAQLFPENVEPLVKAQKEHEMDQQAQKLASKLAKQLFKQKADELKAKAKEIAEAGPPPCTCKPPPPPPDDDDDDLCVPGCGAEQVASVHGTCGPPASGSATAMYPVLLKSVMRAGADVSATPRLWRRTQQHVSQLRVQLDDLRKESVKKEDLKVMEENIVKLVQRNTMIDDTDKDEESISNNMKTQNETYKRGNSNHISVNTGQNCKHDIRTKLTAVKNKPSDFNPKKGKKTFVPGLRTEKPERTYKKLDRAYAVNMCLCSSQKDSKKMSKVGSHSKKSSNDIPIKKSYKGLSHIFSQDKPIIIHKSPHGSNSVKKSKIASGYRSCRSNVACFHKVPSNTSVDELLEILAKWKSDLSKLNNKSNKNRHPSIKSIASDIENKSEMLQNAPIKAWKNLSPIQFQSNLIANASKGVEVPSEVPMNTESEYMGAVNLDIGSGNREQSGEHKSIIIKCINSAKNVNKQYSDKENIHKTLQNNGESTKMHTTYDTSQMLENKLTQNLGLDVEETARTLTIPSDYKYRIKFLGATLTNANSNNITFKRIKSPKRQRSPTTEKLSKHNRTDVLHGDADNHATSNFTTQMPVCSCSVKNEEVRNLHKNLSVEKHGGDCNRNEDKCMDTQSIFKPALESIECVCCDRKLEESRELEVNAFHLLEEYLREKLEEFKSSTCKSSCIKPEEEGKLFSIILQRIKQLITENTNDISCKCISKEPTEGSWHRAYILLEEYLKVKVKRVQCLCFPTETSKEPSVLSNVLEKVSKLIDDDFKRLKDICKCQNNKKGENSVGFETDLPEKDTNNLKYKIYREETINSTDMSNFVNNDRVKKKDIFNEIRYPEKINKQVSNNSIIVTLNTSSQFSPNLEIMNTKSCDAMKISTQNEQTSRIFFTNECCKSTEINFDTNLSIHSTRTSKSHLELNDVNEFLVNQCISIKKEENHDDDGKNKNSTSALIPPKDDKNNITHIIEAEHLDDVQARKETPYIGYTVECSCDRLFGKCTCTKAMISDKYVSTYVNSIWNSLTSNTLRPSDLSYIMDAVPNKYLAENKINAKITEDQIRPIKKTTCDSKTGVRYLDEIILKDSNDNINKNFVSTTTSGEDLCFGPDSEPIDWCSSSSKQKYGNLADGSDKTHDYDLYYPVGNLISRGKSADLSNRPSSVYLNCSCNMVPLCHVKMLVENIESKIINSKCTCDSLCSKICPVHSNLN